MRRVHIPGGPRGGPLEGQGRRVEVHDRRWDDEKVAAHVHHVEGALVREGFQAISEECRGEGLTGSEVGGQRGGIVAMGRIGFNQVHQVSTGFECHGIEHLPSESYPW